MICACSWFSIIAALSSAFDLLPLGETLTIALRESAAYPTIALIVHSLHHHHVSLKVASYIISSPAVPEAINLFLSLFCLLLGFLKLHLQFLDLAILFDVALFLSVLSTSIRNALP